MMEQRQTFRGPRVGTRPILSFKFIRLGRDNSIPRLLSCFPGECVETLALGSWLPLDIVPFDTLFRDILQSFPSIKTLEVREPSRYTPYSNRLGRGFCDYLLDTSAPSAPSSTDPTEVGPHMSHLQTLSLYNFRFDCSSRGRRLYATLRDGLQRRSASGVPIRALKIFNTVVKNSWLESWREFVDDVWYDPATCNVMDEDEAEWSSSEDEDEGGQGEEEDGESSQSSDEDAGEQGEGDEE